MHGVISAELGGRGTFPTWPWPARRASSSPARIRCHIEMPIRTSRIASALDCQRPRILWRQRAGLPSRHPRSARAQRRQNESQQPKTKRPSAVAGWPFRAGDLQSLCRKGTSTQTRTGAAGSVIDGPGRSLESANICLVWSKRHGVLFNCEVARLYLITAATASVKRFLDGIDLRNEIASEALPMNR